MAVTAAEIFTRVQDVIQDTTSVRWPLVELLRWLNDARDQVVLHKPSAGAATVVLDMVLGTYQTVPSTYIGLLRVVRNITAVDGDVRTGGRAIRMVQRDILDSQIPDWHSTAAVPFNDVVKHAIYDPADPLAYYVYPGNTGSGKIEAIAYKTPTPIAVPGSPTLIASYSATIGIPDIYAGTLVDFILYRAYSKDTQFAGNAQRAQAHYQMFANSLGIKIKNEITSNPNAVMNAPLQQADPPALVP